MCKRHIPKVMIRFILVIFSISLLISCADEKLKENNTSVKSDFLFDTISSTISGINYINQIEESHLRNTMFYDNFYNGAGVAIGDINNDDLPDIFFTGNDSPNALYLNQGNFRFEDISKKALPRNESWSSGVAMADINNDGWLDIFVCNMNMGKDASHMQNQLLINQQNNTFKDETVRYGLHSPSQSTQANFLDYDKDGDLDLWVNNTDHYKGIQEFQKKHSSLSQASQPHRLQLFRNDGNKFTDVSSQAKINLPSFGLGLATADFNDDGWVDVYVGNDYFLTDYYFINNGDGTFNESSTLLLDHTTFFSMGCDAADFNNDNILDIVAVDMTPSDHYRNKVMMESMDVDRFNYLKYQLKYTNQFMFNTVQMGLGNGSFNEIGKQLKTSMTDWSWTALLADFNADGMKDYYVTNGYLRDTKNNDFRQSSKKYTATIDPMTGMISTNLTPQEFEDRISKLESTPLKNFMFINDGTASFTDQSQKLQEKEGFSNGAAYGDLDGDGDLDLVINNLGAEATVMKNNSNPNNYIKIKLSNNDKNKYINHSKITCYINNNLQRQDYHFTRGYLSHMDPTVLFSFKSSVIDSINIIWGDDTKTQLSNVEVKGQTITVNKNTSNSSNYQIAPKKAFYNDLTQGVLKFHMIHEEPYFDDFEKEVLLPQKYSGLGPCVITGELNSTVVDEILVGGAAGNEAQLFTFNNGSFQNISSPSIKNDKAYEDLGSLFFDADNDGDLDLYMASGGGGEIKKNALLQDRLYLNDGKAIFSKASTALPKIESSTKCIIPLDIDKDGYMDLFVGGRNNPGKYPLKAKSYLLRNDKGSFKDITTEDFQKNLPDMVSDASAIDIDADGDQDLIVVGEWSQPVVFENKNGSLVLNETNDFSNLKGWWQSIISLDVDNDGDRDFVVGNISQNNKFQPSIKKPLGVLLNDFDDSGSLDIVLTKHYNGNIVPVRGKECSSEQMPFISEKFPTYSGFASSSIDEILGETKIQGAEKKEVNNFSHILLVNKGNFSFDIKHLDKIAQSSPILDMLVKDINGDGYQDVITIGCIDETEPETPSYDSNKGLILLNDQKGNFISEYNIRNTGINAFQNAKSISPINLGNANGFIVGNNNWFVQLFVENK